MRLIRFLGVLALVGWTFPAQAHPFHTSSDFSNGLIHSITGWDHLLAFLAVGLWAAQFSKPARLQFPLLFAATALIGALITSVTPLLALADWGAGLSLLILGGMLLLRTRAPILVAASMIGIIGFVHGSTHQFDSSLGMLGWTLGMAATYGAGVGIALLAKHVERPIIQSAFGLGVFVAGIVCIL